MIRTNECYKLSLLKIRGKIPLPFLERLLTVIVFPHHHIMFLKANFKYFYVYCPLYLPLYNPIHGKT